MEYKLRSSLWKEPGAGACVGQLPARRSVHDISIKQLDLDVDAVVDERIHRIFQFRRGGVHAALLFNPVPAGAVGAVFILTDANPFETGIEHARPPPTFPRQIGIARQVGVDAESVRDLRRPLGRDMVRYMPLRLREASCGSDG
jgi:hypothetical protein